MAVAARPGPSDARVPCPLCGGLIHPIAGKCKHCKADLTSYHAARPAASSPLPALHHARSGNGHTPVTPADAAYADAPYAPAPAATPRSGAAMPGAAMPGSAIPAGATPIGSTPLGAMPLGAMYEASQPVLPPRPADHRYPTEPHASGWRSWPVVVIVVAMVAIVVAVVLMVWPATRRDVDGKHTTVPPAPDRMQTTPEMAAPPPQRPSVTPPPPPAGRDPWSQRQPAPAPQAPGAQPVDPSAQADSDDADDIDLGALTDPFDQPHPDPSRGKLKLNGGGVMYLAMAEHMCRKILQCGGDDAAARFMCDKLSHHAPPSNCPAASRCLEHIDTLSCDAQSSDPMELRRMMTQLGDCADAARC
jgi:hypothetical protein